MPAAGLAAVPNHGATLHSNVTREIFLGPQSGYADRPHDIFQNFGVAVCRDAQNDHVRFIWRVPDDFVSLVHVHVVVITEAAAADLDIVWRVDTEYGGQGEDYDQHSYTALSDVTTTLTRKQIVELDDVSEALPALEAEDWVTIDFQRKGSEAADTLTLETEVIGCLIEYTAEQ